MINGLTSLLTTFQRFAHFTYKIGLVRTSRDGFLRLTIGHYLNEQGTGNEFIINNAITKLRNGQCLACVYPVMDARGRLLSMKEA